MTKVKDILVIAKVVESQLDTEIPQLGPLRERSEEEWFVVIQAKVIRPCCARLDLRYIAVFPQILSVQKVHWRWTRQIIGTRRVCSQAYPGFQLVHSIVSAIGMATSFSSSWYFGRRTTSFRQSAALR